MQKLIVMLLLSLPLIAGCEYVERVNPFAKSVDTMEIYRNRQDSIRRAEVLQRQQEFERRDRARADSLRRAQEAAAAMTETEKYHLIVGAFKTPAYARDYHEKILNQGHDSRILMAPNNFHLVTIRSLDNYRMAVNELIAVRNSGEHEVWLYITE